MEKKVCQSCAMPLDNIEILGTNKDGSKNEEYCVYCYKDGEYTEPNMTMQEMEDLCVSYMKKDGMEEVKARELMSGALCNLKRWEK